MEGIWPPSISVFMLQIGFAPDACVRHLHYSCSSGTASGLTSSRSHTLPAGHSSGWSELPPCISPWSSWGVPSAHFAPVGSEPPRTLGCYKSQSADGLSFLLCVFSSILWHLFLLLSEPLGSQESTSLLLSELLFSRAWMLNLRDWADSLSTPALSPSCVIYLNTSVFRCICASINNKKWFIFRAQYCTVQIYTFLIDSLVSHLPVVHVSLFFLHLPWLLGLKCWAVR